MQKNYLILVVLLFCATSLFSQKTAEQYYHHRISDFVDNGLSPETTGQSGTGANIDVKYHKIYWRINPDSAVKYIKGYIQTNFQTIQANVSAITFDLNSVLTVDSVKFRGAKLAAGNITRTGNILTISLGATLANNFIDSIWVYYQGTPPAVSGAAEGYQKATDLTSGQNFIYSLSESYEDRDWWPCKADMQDKIDSMDIIVNVPWSGADTFWVATNGRLVDSTINGSNRTFTFKNRYPMASYLVCVAVARFNRYYRTPVNIGGVNVPIVFNLIRGKTAATYTSILSAMDLQSQVLTAFSNKFGNYPYSREKHGFYEGLAGAGGMEHQTFSAIAASDLAVPATLSHELMHQWFGDKATFATWADLWLAEGFARYAEALAGELVPATGLVPATELNAAKTSARSITTTPTRITSFANSNQVWSGNNVKAVYDRGCMVVSMLRALSGDTKFFQACTNYLDSLNGSGYRSANTDSLKNNFNRVLGYDLTPFFNDFVIGVGHPTTVVNWNTPMPKKLALSIGSQTRSASSTASYFHNVVVVRAQATGFDTTIVFYDIDGNNLAKAGMSTGLGPVTPGNLLMYDLSFTPTTVTFDAFNQTMSAGSTLKVGTLAVKVLDFSGRKNGNTNDINLTLTTTDPVHKVELLKSNNGTEFTLYGEMQQIANTGQSITFSFKDVQPFSPASYYRAKIYSAADVELSNIVKVQNGLIKGITISPNPANTEVKINFSNPARIATTIKLIGSEGRSLMSATTANGFIRFDVRNLSAGTYAAQILQDGVVAETVKIQIRH